MAQKGLIAFCFLHVLKIAAGLDANCIKPKPIAFWPLDGADKTNDISGNNLHATPFGVSLTTGYNNEPDAAYEFQGTTSSYMKVKSTPLLDVGTGSFSFAALVYPVSATGCFFEWTNNPFGPYIWNYPSKAILVFLNGPSGAVTNLGTTPSIASLLNTWMFLGVVYDTEKAEIRVTVNDKTTTVTGKTKIQYFTKGNDVMIGKRRDDLPYAGASRYKGKMSRLVLWNQALTTEGMLAVKSVLEGVIKRVAVSTNIFKAYQPFLAKATDKTIASTAVLGTESKSTILQCLLVCINASDKCVTISYVDTTKECKWSEKFVSDGTVTALAGSTVYEIKREC